MKKIKFSSCSCEIEKGNFDIRNIPLDCSATWNLISTGYTQGVFQLETKLGQDWSRKVKPQSIEELAAVISIIRPGCLEAGISDEYIQNKFNPDCITYIHKALKPILESTYGCMIYQEQALKIASEIAGFTLEEADDLRKAIGKKIPELMSSLKQKFINGAEKSGIVPRGIAEEIFGWIEKSQRYGFNKSHSIAYAYTGYQTGYLKCHFPHEFFTSFLTYSSYKGDPKEEIYKLVQDARLFGINILPPDIRKLNVHFKIIDDSISFGLSHIRSVGQNAIKTILKNQDNFNKWSDFLCSIPELHRDVGIALIKSGACDCYKMSRIDMIKELEAILGTTSRNENDKKIEIRGLTQKEKDYFFDKIKSSNLSAVDVLEEMVNIYNNQKPSLKQMSKDELQKLTFEFFDGGINIEKGTKSQLINSLIENGYKEIKSVISNEKRRDIIIEKIKALKIHENDTNTGNAMAEKHFLGISLSCSEADDADSSDANHNCIDIAKSGNNGNIKVCAIIDNVKHTKTKKGKNPGSPMCFLTISDSTYSIDHAVVFPDSYEILKSFCKENVVALITGYKKNGSFIVNDIVKLL